MPSNCYLFLFFILSTPHSFLISFNKQPPKWLGPCPPKDSSGLSLNLFGTTERRAPALTPALVSVSGVFGLCHGSRVLAESLASRGH